MNEEPPDIRAAKLEKLCREAIRLNKEQLQIIADLEQTNVDLRSKMAAYVKFEDGVAALLEQEMCAGVGSVTKREESNRDEEAYAAAYEAHMRKWSIYPSYRRIWWMALQYARTGRVDHSAPNPM